MDIRPVRIGLILGLLSIFFGIFWVVYITAGHDDVHDAFDKVSISAGSEAGMSSAHEEEGHGDAHGVPGHHGAASEADEGEGAPVNGHDAHDDPVAEEAHEMLAKGHVHAMGLGLLTLCVSIILALVCLPGWLKTLGSISAGVGGLLYPFSWIIMGYRLPAIGMEAAESSIMPIVGISILLVLGGLFTALAGVAAGLFLKEHSH
jgi:hypothetical protein